MNARMEYRLDAEDKALIEQAASLRGINPSAFTREVAVQEAKNVLRQAHVVHFDELAARECLEALSRPFEPNEALRKALERGSDLGL